MSFSLPALPALHFAALQEALAGWALLLLPSVCADCGRGTGGDALCERCDVRTPQRLPDLPAPAPLKSWTSAATYEASARDWVRRFKYPGRGLAGLDPAANAVARCWIRRAATKVPADALPAAVLPIPLHAQRLRARGFNPSALLAKQVARKIGARLDLDTLVRTRNTPSQTALTRTERLRNVAGAFAARKTASREVWLVDDVATTGATLTEAARALRRAGVQQVHALTLAYRPLGG